MRIQSSSVIIEPYSLDFQTMYLFLKRLLEQSIRSIDIVIHPNYFYGRRIGVNNTYQYIAGVFSIILTSFTKELEEVLLNTNATIYIVERDAWIDTKRIDLECFFKILNQLLGIIDKYTSGVVEVDSITINTMCLREECEEIVIVDYINAPLTWISTDTSIDKKTLLRELVSRRPVEYILSYNICGDKYIPLLVYKPSLGKTIVNYSVSKTCRNIYNYILWSLIDILMK